MGSGHPYPRRVVCPQPGNRDPASCGRIHCFLVGGTSLGVYPAAGLVHYFRGDRLVLVNKSATPMDHLAKLVIHDSIGKVLGSVKAG